jgi:hypothetical protein
MGRRNGGIGPADQLVRGSAWRRCARRSLLPGLMPAFTVSDGCVTCQGIGARSQHQPRPMTRARGPAAQDKPGRHGGAPAARIALQTFTKCDPKNREILRFHSSKPAWFDFEKKKLFQLTQPNQPATDLLVRQSCKSHRPPLTISHTQPVIMMQLKLQQC